MPVLFAVTLFVSASLLFMIQPMVGRMVLPLLGGSPAAWNTCMVFFQIVLLLGYLYAHKLTGKLSPGRQVFTHAAVLVGAIATFGLAAAVGPDHSPIAVIRSLAPQNTSYPMFGVLALLVVAIGVPFFAVSTSAPLLQRWFAYTGHPASRDPYFLYAASNAGSLLSLLAYPLVTEPSLSLNSQAWVFAGGFVALAGLIAFAGSRVNRRIDPVAADKKLAHAAPAPTAAQASPPPEPEPDPEPTWPRKLRWTALAFVPSSLMLGVTFHMTTDIASIPLLWVGPLALYLLTFIIAFAHTPRWFRPVLGNVSPVVTLLLVFVLTSQTSMPSTFISLGLHLVAYFLAALLCHSELARDRPRATHLTNYYLWISVGGMLGGLFNALFAPVVFPHAYEYPIAIAVGCMLIPKLDGGDDRPAEETALGRILDLLIPLAMVAAVGGLTLLTHFESYIDACHWAARQMTAAFQFARVPVALEWRNVNLLVAYAVPAMVCFFFIDRPVRFGLCVAAILFVGTWRQNESSVQHTERSFFGILKVETHDEGNEYRLVHGTTLHGTQIRTERGVLPILALREVTAWDERLNEAQMVAPPGPWSALALAGVWKCYDYKQEPLTYYHRNGPVGLMFHHLFGKDPAANYGMVGLGTGSVSCYAGRGQTVTFYEIDPSVKGLVADRHDYFTYVEDARQRGATVEFVIGDARLKLEEQTDRKYPLLLVDAFSSDSIPVHLLTKQAVELYMDRLTPDGVLALHISNKYVALEYVAARIATELGLEARVMSDSREKAPGKSASSWVVLARKAEHLGPMAGTLADQAEAFLPRSRPLVALIRTHGADATIGDVLKKELADAPDLIDMVRLLDQTDDLFGVDKMVKEVTESIDKDRKTAEGKRAAASASPPDVAAKLRAEAAAQDDAAAKDAVAVRHVERLAARYDKGTPFKTAVRHEYGWRNPALVDALLDTRSGATLGDALRVRHGTMFGPLTSSDVVRLWTDDYSDVLSVMMIPEIQRLRHWLGMPTLEELRK